MKQYNLGFVSDEEIYNHVRETVMRYSANIDLKVFNKNIVDPIKLTFDAKVYGRTMEEVVASECMRQMDKSNNNHIGYFHQNLFRYAGNGWTVPTEGFDVVNEERHIFVEMKNKPSKMKHSAKRALAIKAYDKLLHDKDATVMIVDMQNLSGINVPWMIRMDDMSFVNERLRIVSIDKFYDLIFSHDGAYSQICNALPTILSDIN